jgi:hypothetical protein
MSQAHTVGMGPKPPADVCRGNETVTSKCIPCKVRLLSYKAQKNDRPSVCVWQMKTRCYSPYWSRALAPRSDPARTLCGRSVPVSLSMSGKQSSYWLGVVHAVAKGLSHPMIEFRTRKLQWPPYSSWDSWAPVTHDTTSFPPYLPRHKFFANLPLEHTMEDADCVLFSSRKVQILQCRTMATIQPLLELHSHFFSVLFVLTNTGKIT